MSNSSDVSFFTSLEQGYKQPKVLCTRRLIIWWINRDKSASFEEEEETDCTPAEADYIMSVSLDLQQCDEGDPGCWPIFNVRCRMRHKRDCTPRGEQRGEGLFQWSPSSTLHRNPGHHKFANYMLVFTSSSESKYTDLLVTSSISIEQDVLQHGRPQIHTNMMTFYDAVKTF